MSKRTCSGAAMASSIIRQTSRWLHQTANSRAEAGRSFAVT
jgi:hypothetical protein